MIRRSIVLGAVGILTVAGASVTTTGCSSQKTPETTIAAGSSKAAESTVSVISVPSADDAASSEGNTATSTVLEPSIAVGEPNPATPTTANTGPSTSSAPNSETGGDNSAAVAEGPAILTDEQLTSAFTAMGLPVAAVKLSCVKEKAGKTDMSAPEPPPEFLRALMSCVPKSLVEANGAKLSASATKSGVTVAKAGCFQEKTFETMAATDIAEFTKLLDANAPIDFPADTKAKLKENTKICALSDAQFLSLLEG